MKYKQNNDEEMEKSIDEVADILTEKVQKNLGLNQNEQLKFASKIYGEGVLTKETDNKTIDFMRALCARDLVEIKALGESVAADGGVLVPDSFQAELVRDIYEQRRMRSLVRTVEIKTDILKIPKLVSRPHVRWTSESSSKSTTTASFEEKTLSMHKMASILYLSDELAEDSPIPVVQEMIRELADVVGEEEDRVIQAGTGIGQPTGLTQCAISSISCAGNISFDNLINLVYLLPAKYRQRAVFLASNENIRELRKLKDNDGRYIWQEAVAPNQPETIMGYPIYCANYLPDSEIYFLDLFSTYWLGVKPNGISVTVSNIAGEGWERDNTGIRIVERLAGNCVLENAARKLISIP